MIGNLFFISYKQIIILRWSRDLMCTGFSLFLFIYLIGKLHTHLVGIEPTTSLSILLPWEKEVQIEL